MLASGAEPDWDQMNRSAVDLLQQYIRIESVNPPGNTAEAANFFKRFSKKTAFPRSFIPADRTARPIWWRGSPAATVEEAAAAAESFDVVPVDREAWKMDPFAAVIQNGYIWGRGTMDMKGIGVQQ